MTVWSWGANSYGQLAQGTCEDQLLPRQAKCPDNIKSIQGGGGHTLVVTDCGKLFTCGSNSKGQLGVNSTDDSSDLAQVVIGDCQGATSTEGDGQGVISGVGSVQKVLNASGGWDFSLAITDDLQLYSWGSNAFGQLGDPTFPNKCLLPRKVCPGLRFIQVAAGLRHVVGLTESGDIYCWGHSKKGQCGVGDKPALKLTTPSKVLLPGDLGRVVSVAAGSYHSVALNDKGNVYIWGCNKYGQCAQDPVVNSQVNTPYMVKPEVFEGGKVTCVQSGWTHLIAQTESGMLYSWGRCDYGQLGRSVPDGVTSSYVPACIETSIKPSSFSCGSEHTLFLAGGSVFALGWNEHGLCATGDEVNVKTVTKVSALENQSVLYIACGGGHCFVVTKDDCG